MFNNRNEIWGDLRDDYREEMIRLEEEMQDERDREEMHREMAEAEPTTWEDIAAAHDWHREPRAARLMIRYRTKEREHWDTTSMIRKFWSDYYKEIYEKK